MVSACPITVSSHAVGNEVRTTATFTNLADNGGPLDPTLVRCDVTDPDGTLITYEYPEGSEIVRDGIGEYYLPILLNTAGYWIVRWWSDGNMQASSTITIRATQ